MARIFVGTAKASKDVTFRNMVPNRTNPDFRGQAVTFEVDRVWKGPANRTVVVHNITEGSEPTARGQGMHTFEFSVGHRYFLRVYLMHPDTRIRLGLNPDGPEAFMAGCPLRESRDPLAEGLVDDDPGIAVVTP